MDWGIVQRQRRQRRARGLCVWLWKCRGRKDGAASLLGKSRQLRDWPKPSLMPGFCLQAGELAKPLTHGPLKHFVSGRSYRRGDRAAGTAEPSAGSAEKPALAENRGWSGWAGRRLLPCVRPLSPPDVLRRVTRTRPGWRPAQKAAKHESALDSKIACVCELRPQNWMQSNLDGPYRRHWHFPVVLHGM